MKAAALVTWFFVLLVAAEPAFSESIRPWSPEVGDYYSFNNAQFGGMTCSDPKYLHYFVDTLKNTGDFDLARTDLYTEIGKDCDSFDRAKKNSNSGMETILLNIMTKFSVSEILRVEQIPSNDGSEIYFYVIRYKLQAAEGSEGGFGFAIMFEFENTTYVL